MDSFQNRTVVLIPCDLKEALKLLETGKVKVQALSTIYKLEDIMKAFDDTMSNKIMKAYINIGD